MLHRVAGVVDDIVYWQSGAVHLLLIADDGLWSISVSAAASGRLRPGDQAVFVGNCDDEARLLANAEQEAQR